MSTGKKDPFNLTDPNYELLATYDILQPGDQRTFLNTQSLRGGFLWGPVPESDYGKNAIPDDAMTFFRRPKPAPKSNLVRYLGKDEVLQEGDERLVQSGDSESKRDEVWEPIPVWMHGMRASTSCPAGYRRRLRPTPSAVDEIDKLKAEWADLARQIERITGEKPEAEPVKPVCANCKWRKSNYGEYYPSDWMCEHPTLGVHQENYCPVTGQTNYVLRACRNVNKGDCEGFEPVVKPPKRTWKQFFRWFSGV